MDQKNNAMLTPMALGSAKRMGLRPYDVAKLHAGWSWQRRADERNCE